MIAQFCLRVKVYFLLSAAFYWVIITDETGGKAWVGPGFCRRLKKLFRAALSRRCSSALAHLAHRL